MVVVVLGVVVLVVAIIALHQPGGHDDSGTPGQSPVASESSSGGTPTSASRSPSPSGSASGSSFGGFSPSVGAGGGGDTAPAPDRASLQRSVPLVVLNDTQTTGLASGAASRFEGGGWRVSDYTNYSNDIVSTCAYFDPSVTDAKAAAEALQQQYPTIKRVKRRFAGLPSGPVVVVLTYDYSPG